MPVARRPSPVAVVGSLLLIAHLSSGRSILTRAPSAGRLVALGGISYELYLWHYPLLLLLLEVYPGSSARQSPWPAGSL